MNKVRLFFILLAVAVMVVLAAGSLPAAEKININTASVKELTQLDRIGPTLAKRIVAYREKHGPFKKSEDIIKVKGIGPKTFKAFKDRITAEKPKKKAPGEDKTAGKPEKKASREDETVGKPEKKAPGEDETVGKPKKKISGEDEASGKLDKKPSEEDKSSDKEKKRDEEKSSEE